MEITYIGHSCFKIKGKEASLVIDPYDSKIGYKLPKLEADILLTTHEHFDHNNVSGISNYSLLINSPGEYETKGVFVYGISTAHDDKKGAERGKNTIYVIDIDGFTLLHLGDLGHELSDEALEKIASVDVLMIPIGGKYTITASTAAKVISSIEPGIVIPMHYATAELTGNEGLQELDGLDKFLNAMGVSEASTRKEDKLKLTSKNDIPEETQIIILTPAH